MLAFPDVRVPDVIASDLKDISTEQSRTYFFPDKSEVRIYNPVALHVSKSGGHRIVDTYGNSHYIPKGWNHLSWCVQNDQPHISF